MTLWRQLPNLRFLQPGPRNELGSSWSRIRRSWRTRRRLGLFVFSGLSDLDSAALQSGGGKDDLTVVATITMESEESLGLDAASTARQEASTGGQAAPQVKEEVKKEEEKIELPPEHSEEPSPLIEEKKPKKKVVDVKPSTPSPAIEAQEERHAASRTFEARRSQVLALSQYDLSGADEECAPS